MRTRILVLAAVVLGVAPMLALAGMSPVVSAKMTGSQETPKKGEAGGSGIAVVNLDAKKGSVCWQFKNLKKVSGPQAAHIHTGAKGKAGPVFIALGAKYKAKGCTKSTAKNIEAVESKPNAYYVNIHNKEYGDGVVRGQLAAGMVK